MNRVGQRSRHTPQLPGAVVEPAATQSVDLAQETYDLAIGAPDSLYRKTTEDPGDNPLRRQAMFNQATSAATEQALTVAMEFPVEK